MVLFKKIIYFYHYFISRLLIKKTLVALETEKYDEASAAYKSAVPVIDRAVSHGLIQKNKAARHKSRLNAKVKALQS